MGISIEVWRQRIGCFSNGVSLSGVCGRRSGLAHVMPHIACAIAVLLLIAGAQPNPDPTTKLNETVHRLNDLFKELRDTRETVFTYIDNSVRELTTKLCDCENIITAQTAHVDIVEQMQVAMAAQLAALQPSTVNTTIVSIAAPVATLPKTISMYDVVCEVDMRVSNKVNIVLSGADHLPPFSDTEIVTNFLRYELGIDATVFRHIRLGKLPTNVNRPSLLLVTLSSNDNVRAAIRTTKALRSSTDDYVRDYVFLNADLTPDQR